MAGGGGAERPGAGGLLPPALRQHRRRESRERLSVCSKLCYAVGGAPYQITGCALGFFLQIYLLDVAQVDAFYASIILFVGRVWDAITDPMVGFFISKTSWTRFGRLMPWIMFSTPFAIISYFLIWFVPDISTGQVMWYLVFYCAFQTLVTCFHVPYSALTMFISREQSERDSATAYRMTVEVLGTVLGTAIQGQIVGKVDTPCVGSPFFFGLTNSSVAMEELNMTHDTGSLTDTRNAYMIAAGVIGGLYVLCALILVLGVRERRESCELQSDEPVSFFQGLKLVMNHGPYIKLIAGFLFTSLAFMLLEGNFALFCTYTLGFRNEFQNILLAIMLSATLTIPFWQWFLTRFGKKRAVYVGISSAIPFLIAVVVLDSNLFVTYVVAVAAGISVAAAFLLPWSMLPDVIDDFKLQHPSSHGHEAIFFSFYVFFTKFTAGVSLGISTLSLDFAGYQTRGCSQPGQVNLTLKMLVSAVPVGLILLSLLLFKLYPIDEEKRSKNKKALQDLSSQRDGVKCWQISRNLPQLHEGGEQQQLGVGQHRTGQHRVTRAGSVCSLWGSPGARPLGAGPAWWPWRCWRSRGEHPLPPTRDLCPSRALHGAHRALVVYITHMVVPHQEQALSLPGSGGQGSPAWHGFARTAVPSALPGGDR